MAGVIEELNEKVRRETAEKVRRETAEKVRRETTEKVRRETTEKVQRETTEKVRRETLLESTLDFATKLIMQGKLTKEEIAKVCSLSLEEVKALAGKNTARMGVPV